MMKKLWHFLRTPSRRWSVLALLLVGVRLVGLRPMCVLSGSMEPTYHTGSLIYVKPCAPEDVQVGDAITFVLNEDLDVVTHRVISIDAENEHFYTQGDANDAPDGAPVYFKNLIGRPVFTIPYLGYVSHWVSNPPGMYLAIAIAIVLIVLAFLPDMLRKDLAVEYQVRNNLRAAMALCERHADYQTRDLLEATDWRRVPEAFQPRK